MKSIPAVCPLILDQELYLSLATYLLTPRSRVLLEKLTGLQLVKKFPAFYGTRRFITTLTNVRHLSLSWASPIQATYPHPTSWRSIVILSTHLRLGLPSGLFPSGFPPRPYTPPLLTHTRHMPSPSHSSRFSHSSMKTTFVCGTFMAFSVAGATKYDSMGTFSTRPPFLSLLSRRAHSGR